MIDPKALSVGITSERIFSLRDLWWVIARVFAGKIKTGSKLENRGSFLKIKVVKFRPHESGCLGIFLLWRELCQFRNQRTWRPHLYHFVVLPTGSAKQFFFHGKHWFISYQPLNAVWRSVPIFADRKLRRRLKIKKNFEILKFWDFEMKKLLRINF